MYRAARIPEERWEQADKLWRAHYAKHKPKLIPGARAVLAAVARRAVVGLVTSGDRERVSRQLREFGLTRLFRVRVCAGDTPERKPHPAPLLLAMKKLRLAAGDVVYVGDTPEDLEMCRAAGVCCIGVLGPFPSSERLRSCKPEYLLANLRDLPALLRSLETGMPSPKREIG